MTFRKLLLFFALSVAALADTTVRGKLTQREGKAPTVESSGKSIILNGDDSTLGVLNDKRLAGADIEAVGHFSPSGEFIVNPIHTKALYVFHDGQRHTVSYWCELCSIRTYRPGICWCCQEETALDLQKAEKE